MTELNVISDTNQLSPSHKPHSFSYEAIRKANKFYVLHFSHYLPLYRIPHHLFFRDCGALLTLHFSMVYGADLELEAVQEGYVPRDGVAPWVRRRQEYITLLKELNLYHAYVEEELQNTTRYWELEDEMFLDNVMTPESLVEIFDVIPGDVVATHYLCHRILGLSIDMDRIRTIRALEILEELEAQLIEYPRDVAENNFNIYRMFVRLYETEAVHHMEQERRRHLSIFHECMDKLQQKDREVFYQIFNSRAQFHQEYYFLEQPIIPAIPEPVAEQ